MEDEKTRENEEGRREIRVGYALESKKVDSFLKPSLINYATERGIHFVAVDLQKPSSCGPIECLIHKLYGPDWERQLLDFQSQYPDVLIIDPPSAILRLHDRTSMLDAVTSLPVRTPNQFLLQQHDQNDHGLRFPLIAKPLSANGESSSHEMALVFDAQGLNKVQPPVVLQEFVNHGGVLFKLYVAGDHFRCVKRPSLPDINLADAAAAADDDEGLLVPFSRISNLDSAVTSDAEMPPSELIRELARGLKNNLKLNLFNVDLIRDSNTNTFMVIDINYFPGYAKLPGFEAFLTDFFLDITRLHNNALQQTAS